MRVIGPLLVDTKESSSRGIILLTQDNSRSAYGQL